MPNIGLTPEQRIARRQEREKRRSESERLSRARTRDETAALQKKRYLKAISEWGTLSAGCKAARISVSTVLQWREHDTAFAIEEHQAREALIDALEAEALRRGVKGVQRPVYQGGALAGYVTEYSDLLLQLLLRANRPEKYREKVDVAVTQVIKSISGVTPTDVL